MVPKLFRVFSKLNYRSRAFRFFCLHRSAGSWEHSSALESYFQIETNIITLVEIHKRQIFERLLCLLRGRSSIIHKNRCFWWTRFPSLPPVPRHTLDSIAKRETRAVAIFSCWCWNPPNADIRRSQKEKIATQHLQRLLLRAELWRMISTESRKWYWTETNKSRVSKNISPAMLKIRICKDTVGKIEFINSTNL